MNTPLNPQTVHAPLGRYHHTIKVPDSSEWLVVSGQVGMDASGALASGARAQSEQVFRNILACLEANNMGAADLVKLTAYLTDARYVADYRAARSAVLGDDREPASTLVIVAGLAAPEIVVEVEAWAART